MALTRYGSGTTWLTKDIHNALATRGSTTTADKPYRSHWSVCDFEGMLCRGQPLQKLNEALHVSFSSKMRRRNDVPWCQSINERVFASTQHTTEKANTMALPLPPGLTPPEVAFICEMEMVTVIPRQRLEALDLLGVS